MNPDISMLYRYYFTGRALDLEAIHGPTFSFSRFSVIKIRYRVIYINGQLPHHFTLKGLG